MRRSYTLVVRDGRRHNQTEIKNRKWCTYPRGSWPFTVLSTVRLQGLLSQMCSKSEQKSPCSNSERFQVTSSRWTKIGNKKTWAEGRQGPEPSFLKP